MCVSVCPCVTESYPASAEAARAGRGGAGRLSRMWSGQLTGRRPVHWWGRKNERKVEQTGDEKGKTGGKKKAFITGLVLFQDTKLPTLPPSAQSYT